MAFQFSPNNSPANGAEALVALKTLLKAAGWKLKRYVDGSSIVTVTDQAADDAMTTGKLNVTGSWFLVEQPAIALSPYAGTRQICFQRGSSGEAYWWVTYSKAGFNLDGNSSTIPTATDRADVVGTNNSGSQLFRVGGGYRLQLGAEADSNKAPVFYCVTYDTGHGSTDNGARSVLLLDFAAQGSFAWGEVAGNDADPGMLYFRYDTNAAPAALSESSLISGSNFWRGWSKYGNAGAAWTSYPARAICAGMGPDPHSGKAIHAALPIGKVVVSGWKGLTTMLRWQSVGDAKLVDLQTRTAAGDMIVFDDAALPWPGSGTTPLT